MIRRDRGFTDREQTEFQRWLDSDARHPVALARSTQTWSVLDHIPAEFVPKSSAAAARPSTALPAQEPATIIRPASWRWLALGAGLAAAAAVAILLVRQRTAPPSSSLASAPVLATASVAAAAVFAAPEDEVRAVTLTDGTAVRLNTGAAISLQFSAHERGITLLRGEAHFEVTKNPARPFVVHAGALRVRAVGTAFNVRLQAASVEVLVTEGRVQLATVAPRGPTANPAGTIAPVAPVAPATAGEAGMAGAPSDRHPLLEAGQRAFLPTVATLDPASPAAFVVSQVDAAEMARALAWHPALLRLGGSTLAEVIQEFERRSGQRVILADAELGELRVGGRFRADDLDGFATLLATTLELDVGRAADGTLVLRKKKRISR